MKKKKADLKLWELKKWTKVKMWEHIMEFLWVDGMYCRWLFTDGVSKWKPTIIWHANQKVSEYWEIV